MLKVETHSITVIICFIVLLRATSIVILDACIKLNIAISRGMSMILYQTSTKKLYGTKIMDSGLNNSITHF